MSIKYLMSAVIIIGICSLFSTRTCRSALKDDVMNVLKIYYFRGYHDGAQDTRLVIQMSPAMLTNDWRTGFWPRLNTDASNDLNQILELNP